MVSQPPSKVSGLLYGLGLGGFVDGIVLHQILQWHHMVSDVSRYPVNTIAGFGGVVKIPGSLNAAP
jgi:uncharacterized membrane protein